MLRQHGFKVCANFTSKNNNVANQISLASAAGAQVCFGIESFIMRFLINIDVFCYSVGDIALMRCLIPCVNFCCNECGYVLCGLNSVVMSVVISPGLNSVAMSVAISPGLNSVVMCAL